MPHRASPQDLRYRAALIAGEVRRADFRHRDHLRLAYTFLCDGPASEVFDGIAGALRAFLSANRAPAWKFHLTITHAWVMAVSDAMARTSPATDFDGFIAAAPELLDPDFVTRHYRRGTLYADAGRARYVPPDLAPFDTEPALARAEA